MAIVIDNEKLIKKIKPVSTEKPKENKETPKPLVHLADTRLDKAILLLTELAGKQPKKVNITATIYRDKNGKMASISIKDND